MGPLGGRTEATGLPNAETLNPLDNAEFFIRQQYVDLLGREPDETGFNFWSDQLLACGVDRLCISTRRRYIAAEFFITREFQDSGLFIYSIYAGALGRRPGYIEYASDRGAVIGGANLEAEKALFARSFVQRPEFLSKYQANLTAESFVDALIENVSSSLNLINKRDALIARYTSGSSLTESRALTLRELADNPAFRQTQYNSAFVLIEYFAYLRRNPDREGYEFWLQVLNSDGSNYRGMVCSFITSAEYQVRFGSVVTQSDRQCGR